MIERYQSLNRYGLKGSISVEHGNICSVDGLVAHLSILDCHKVHKKASSLHACLAAEMFPRLDILSESFLKNRLPSDESIALYFSLPIITLYTLEQYLTDI